MSSVDWPAWTAGGIVLSAVYYVCQQMENHPAISSVGRGALIGVAIGAACTKSLLVAEDKGPPFLGVGGAAAQYAVGKAVEPIVVTIGAVIGGVLGGVAGGTLYLAS